ncbi:hypothetical protein KZ463_08885, partial [Glaesserella parasuis]|nr:hypothetical protein [Glaesserella parasuis]
EYAHLNIEKTTNRLEGLFKELKQKLSIHNGLTKKHKIMFIKDFLNINLLYISQCITRFHNSL